MTNENDFNMNAHRPVLNPELAALPEATRLALLTAVVDSIRWAQAYSESTAREHFPQTFDTPPRTETAARLAALQTGRDGGYNHSAVCVTADLERILGLPSQPTPVLPAVTSPFRQLMDMTQEPGA